MCGLSTCSSTPAPTRSARSTRARGAAVRAGCERHGIRLGLHTASAVNVAEYAPFVGDAVDRYLEAYVDAAALLGAGWIVVHAGFHFTSDRDQRMQAGLERLQRLADYAERKRRADPAGKPEQGTRAGRSPLPRPYGRGVALLFRRIRSPAFRLSFTANHAHLVPEGVAGFVEALDFARVHEVRLADCFRNGYEVHLRPGDGDLDFADMFRRIEGAGFRGHYMNAFGSLDDMLAGRDDLVRLAEAAGIAIG